VGVNRKKGRGKSSKEWVKCPYTIWGGGGGGGSLHERVTGDTEQDVKKGKEEGYQGGNGGWLSLKVLGEVLGRLRG